MTAALDEELINDFFGEYDDACLSIREILIELDHTPDDPEAPHALFRSMHSVKSNLRMMSLNELSEFIHHLENILDQIRNNQRQYIHLLSDLFMLSLETCRGLCYAQLQEQPNALIQLPEFVLALKNVHDGGNDEAIIINAIRLFDPGFEYEKEEDESVTEVMNDMAMFKQFSLVLEQRMVSKQGSTNRILDMALAMNALANNPIDVAQLTVAVYMHDIGMAFLPSSLANKETVYTDAERERMSNHPSVAAQVLQGLGEWSEAVKIVLQHHERVDGNGYPNKLTDNEIVPGAKLLNILDTFDSMTQSRADREHKRTLIRVIAEINGKKGVQFDAGWVDIFNQYIRQKFSK